MGSLLLIAMLSCYPFPSPPATATPNLVLADGILILILRRRASYSAPPPSMDVEAPRRRQLREEDEMPRWSKKRSGKGTDG
jgi:hypothetical protein